MSPSNAELQRLLRLLSETATKAEEEAYAAGWRDCRAAIVNAVSALGDAPLGSNGLYNPLPEMPHAPLNGAAPESSYTN